MFTQDAFNPTFEDDFDEGAYSRSDEDEEERGRIMEALEQSKGNRSEAARLLGISKSTFHDRARRLHVPAGYGRPGTVNKT